MEANFDLILSGCNTRCKHCYVSGGPGGLMAADDALRCIERLDELAEALPFPAGFTLDNEPMNHPELLRILRAVASVRHIRHYHHGMTTGIALLRRPDREAVVRAYLELGCDDFGITLHGGEAHHDEIVRRKGAYKAALEAAAFFRACGAKLGVSLMLNRFFPADAAQIDRVLDGLRPDFVYFAVPNYTPHANMPGFDDYRASLPDLEALTPWLQKWGLDAAGLIARAARSTPAAVAVQLAEGPGLRELFAREQHELYLSVHQDCRLYLGNTGVETACLGDLRTLDLAETAEFIRRAPGNRDYGAFYEADELPPQEEVLRALGRLPRDRVYDDPASVICSALASMGVPTKILNCN